LCVSSLTTKPSTSWDQLESSHFGSHRLCMSLTQHVRRLFESIAFHNGESLNDFSLHLIKMVHEVEILGDPYESWKVTAKYLCIIPK
jgi:hypothetical protein